MSACLRSSNSREEEQMEQLERITQMEQLLREVSDVVESVAVALEKYQGAQEKIRKLSDYYDSPQWMEDYDDCCAGKFPHAFRCGVLTQDEVYDVLMEHDRLMELMRRLSGKKE